MKNSLNTGINLILRKCSNNPIINSKFKFFDLNPENSYKPILLVFTAFHILVNNEK